MFLAGGFHKFSSWEKLASNPKFKFVLEDKSKDGYCTFIVSLQTKSAGDERKMDEVGFGIFEFKNNKHLDGKFLKDHHIENSGDSVERGVERLPQVTKQFKLKPGKYMIIPFTTWKRPKEERDFLLRIFSEKPSDLKAIV